MSKKNSGLNLYDFLGFPNYEQRQEVKKSFNLQKLRLMQTKTIFWDNSYFLRYFVWSHDINNFCHHLVVHFLLMYYHYQNNPLDIFNFEYFQSPESIHKIYFDMFAEDTCLYLISYLDKQLEMFSDLYSLNQLSQKKRSLSRMQIIVEMSKYDELQELASKYQCLVHSKVFKHINKIRNDFVHNKSITYYGTAIKGEPFGEEVIYDSAGISTKETYCAICTLIHDYIQLCTYVNHFFMRKLQKILKEE